jgi:hypothetical protein
MTNKKARARRMSRAMTYEEAAMTFEDWCPGALLPRGLPECPDSGSAAGSAWAAGRRALWKLELELGS